MSQFYPRPEAQATTWDELMPPVQKAVLDLLVRIQGAHHNIPSKNSGDECSRHSTQQAGNCFLVYGLRGSGKTSVLLNAQRVICRKYGNTFFEAQKVNPPIKETEVEKGLREAAEKKAKDAREDAEKRTVSLREGGLVWLEILNLEPLPSEANLLTVLLTQVRNALHSHSDKRQSERRSIFEEDANSARQQLNTLINDATLMWQNVVEPDTRNITNRQVKAADIYAGFQEKFKKAMDKLVEELIDPPSSEKKLSIVLPIDNIDRSTDHLQSIVKLAQLVSHPNLWLVMAGDRVEVETFLERAYWKELIRSSDGAGAKGKMGNEGEDETLVMARRQANATAQKLWPTNHRIEVNLLRPEETLNFSYQNHAASNAQDITIRQLLEKIKIPTTDGQRAQCGNIQKERISEITLYHFFDLTKLVEQKCEKPALTRAAHHGLLLPARSVLDLWQLLDWLVVEDSCFSTSGNDFKAEKVARTMLRIAIDGSDMPSEIARKFQNDILRRGENGGTALYFKKELLKLRFMASANHDFEHALTPVIPETALSIHKLRSRLVIRNIEDITLSLQHKYSPIEQFDSSNCRPTYQYPQPFVIESANNKEQIELAPLVAAWLMVLYDILVLAENGASSWVIGSELDDTLPNVSIHHTLVTKVEKYKKREFNFYWTVPNWGMFFSRNLFRLNWQDFREINSSNLSDDQQQVHTLAPKLLAAGWVLCVLKTTVKLINSIDNHVDFLKKKNSLPELENTADIQAFENEVMLAAAHFYQLIQEKKQEQLKLAKEKRIIEAAYEVMIVTGEWLETEFIYFLSSAYVPIKLEDPTDFNKRLNAIWDYFKNSNALLRNHWEENLPFILAELDEKLHSFQEDANEKITTSDKKPENATGDVNREKNPSLAELLFADLYLKLEPSKE